MATIFVPSSRDLAPASLLNAVFIGYMMGTYSTMGRGGAQAIANMAGEYVGREILAFARSKGLALDRVEELAEFLRESGLAGAVAIRQESGKIVAEVSQCGICPKRIGKYQFDGTACPWGGILIGALQPILHRDLSVAVGLKPAETCTITLTPKKSR